MFSPEKRELISHQRRHQEDRASFLFSHVWKDKKQTEGINLSRGGLLQI